MNDVMERTYSGTFLRGSRTVLDEHRSADWRRPLPREDKSPSRVEQSKWRLEGGLLVELKVEYFYFPLRSNGQDEHYSRYTLTVGGELLDIKRVENYYASDGTVAAEKVILSTSAGRLVMYHVRILDEEGLGTQEFLDRATWCERELIPSA